MRKFNPEKELYKIQHGSKNKIILFIISLLVVGVIGYSFALYQVRYSKRIIYTKVAPFNIRDVILSVKVEGESTSRTSFPPKTEGLSFSGLECDKENTTTGGWNHDTWSLDLNTKGPNKCTVFFKKSQSFSDVIKVDNTTIFNDDPDKNLRYAGKSPNNYVWFNCDDYNKLSQETAASKCEKWRIIGLFNNITKSDGTKENLVKIIRADSIGNIAWNTANTNNWANASLQKSLNGTYYNGTDLENGKGITDETREMIEQVTWNLGGFYPPQYTPVQYYNYERGKTVPSGAPSTWNGYIALMYASDYGFATSGLKDDPTYNREGCLSSKTNMWADNSGYPEYHSNCAGNDWLWDPNNTQWILTPPTTNSYYGYRVHAYGGIGYTVNGTKETVYAARPSLYLKSTVQIADGNGSNETPYILVP